MTETESQRIQRSVANTLERALAHWNNGDYAAFVDELFSPDVRTTFVTASGLIRGRMLIRQYWQTHGKGYLSVAVECAARFSVTDNSETCALVSCSYALLLDAQHKKTGAAYFVVRQNGHGSWKVLSAILA